MTRRVLPMGDTALVVEVAGVDEARTLAEQIRADAQWPDDADVVVGHRSVTVVADPDAVDLHAWATRLREPVAADWVGPGRGDPPRQRPPTDPRTVRIPVRFDGPDLEDVAHQVRTTPEGVVEQLTTAVLTVSFVGFLPGFAYLEGLPPALAAVPRRPSPRPRVPAGSVALGGGFAGVYPHGSPGGWHLVGRTGFSLFDPDTPPFSALAPGDRVRFSAGEDPGPLPPAKARPRLRAEGPRHALVQDPGLFTTVQDLGRRGVAHLGVPPAGAADRGALRAANRLVGNDDGAGALEVTARGPTLVFAVDAHVAVTGDTAVHVDGRALHAGTVLPVSAGQTLAVGAVAGDLRAYVAVGGGVVTPSVLGSRSSDVLTGLGPGALRTGDSVAIGAPTRPHGRLLAGVHGAPPASSGATREPSAIRRVVRVLPGPDTLGGTALSRLEARQWEVQPTSDRMGVRLCGDAFDPGAASVASRGIVTGAVQLPPDGQPVVLLCDHATVGGYPVPATVISADVDVFGRCRPGDMVVFHVVDGLEAARARAAARRALERAVVGWYPGRVD